MSEKKTISINLGGGFFTLLAAAFITLKLAGVTEIATWSWWWVLSPFWLPLAIVVGFMLAALLFLGVCALVVAIAER